jgi:N-acylneuraminate cytidylyltransferase
MTKDLVAVVTVRKGSQRVKNKNFKPFCGKNLLEYKIETLKKVKKLDEIIINTDSDEAIKIAKDYDISFHKRQDYYASSECTNSEFWSHIGEKTDSKFIMFTHCTNPLVKVETYNKIIDSFNLSKFNNDSINTVTEVKEFLYLENKPINFNPSKAPNSQDLREVTKLNFAVNILSTEDMFKRKTLVGRKPIFYKLDDIEGYDINTNFEFDFAEYLFKKHSFNA